MVASGRHRRVAPAPPPVAVVVMIVRGFATGLAFGMLAVQLVAELIWLVG